MTDNDKGYKLRRIDYDGVARISPGLAALAATAITLGVCVLFGLIILVLTEADTVKTILG